jgi:hypothetical protein
VRAAARAVLFALASAVALSAALPVAAQASTPQADLGGVVAAVPGEIIVVRGAQWPAATNVLVEVCGNLAGNGDADCDRTRSRSTGIGQDGVLSVSIEVSAPPSPCPCVVRVTDLRSFHRVYLPLDIPGAPIAPVTDPDLGTHDGRSLRVKDVRITDHRRVAEWFGLAPQRTVTFSVENIGTEALAEIPVEVLSGGGEPDTSRAVLTIGDLAPGDERRTSVTVTLDTLSVGSRTLRIEAGSVGWQFSVERQTSSFPWGLLVVALLLAQLVVVWLRNRLRRRLHGDGRPTGDGGPEPGGDESEQVIDLREPVVEIDLRDAPSEPDPAATPPPTHVVQVPVAPDSPTAQLIAALTRAFDGVELPPRSDVVGFVELLLADAGASAGGPRPQRFVLSIDGTIGDHRWIELENDALARTLSVPVLPPDLLAAAMVEAILDRREPAPASATNDAAALGTQLFATERSLTQAAAAVRTNLEAHLRFATHHGVDGWSVFLVLCTPTGDRVQAVSVGLVEHPATPSRTFTNVQFSSPVSTLPVAGGRCDQEWLAESWCSRRGRRIEMLHKIECARALAGATS